VALAFLIDYTDRAPSTYRAGTAMMPGDWCTTHGSNPEDLGQAIADGMVVHRDAAHGLDR
jgi:hypothetical protein